MRLIALMLVVTIPAIAEPVTTARGVKLLTVDQAHSGLPVEMRAIVTLYEPSMNMLVVQDRTDALYVKWTGPALHILPGTEVLIHGVTGEGKFAPIVIAR